MDCDGKSPRWSQPLAQFLESRGRIGPEPDGIDGHDCVESGIEFGQPLYMTDVQRHPPFRDRDSVSSSRVTDHDFGRVHSDDVPGCADLFGGVPQRETRTKSDF